MIEIHRVNSTLHVRGRLSRRTRGLFEGMLEQLLRRGSHHVAVDLRRVTELDSAGAEALVQLRERLQREGRSLVLVTQ